MQRHRCGRWSCGILSACYWLVVGGWGCAGADELLACGPMKDQGTQAGTDMRPDAKVPAVTVVVGGCTTVRQSNERL